MENVTVNQLRWLLAVIDTGSFTLAAELEQVAVPKLFKKVRRLESDLGLQLFAPNGRCVRPTSDALTLARRIRPIVVDLDEVAHLVSQLGEGSRGIVTIACVPQHISRYFGAAFSVFRDEHPGIDIAPHMVSVDVDPGISIAIDRLLDGSVELAVSQLTSDEVESFPLWRTSVVAVMSPSHPMRHRKTVRISELSRESLLVQSGNFWSRRRAVAAADTEGATLTWALESSSEAIIATACAGYGVAIVGDDNFVPNIDPPFPLLIDANGNVSSTVVSLRWRKHGYLSGAAQNFIDFVMSNKTRLDKHAGLPPYALTESLEAPGF